MGKKVRGIKLENKGAYAPELGKCTYIEVEGTGRDGGYAIPRYKAEGFKMRFNPYPSGVIRAHIGAKLAEDGIVYYPDTADVDPAQAARAQALVDYNNSAGRMPSARKDMAAIYGDLYTNEFERLASLNNRE